MSDSGKQEAELKRAELSTDRHRLCIEKQAVQSQIAEINTKLKVTLPKGEYLKLQSQRGNLVKQISEIEIDIAAMNASVSTAQTAIDIKYKEVKPSFVRIMGGIRDKWHNYSMDADNHQKNRETAWKISQEIGSALSLYFKDSK